MRNLNAYLSNIESCPTSLFVAVISTILRVLHACERKGVTRHGDLHAGNILIGEPDDGNLDAALNPIEPIYVSDFGYGATGAAKTPKDDYHGLAEIADLILAKIDWDSANTTDRQLLMDIKSLLAKVLRETTQSERRSPLEILKAMAEIRTNTGRLRFAPAPMTTSPQDPEAHASPDAANMKVGEFQQSEMLEMIGRCGNSCSCFTYTGTISNS